MANPPFRCSLLFSCWGFTCYAVCPKRALPRYLTGIGSGSASDSLGGAHGGFDVIGVEAGKLRMQIGIERGKVADGGVSVCHGRVFRAGLEWLVRKRKGLL
jgi:hypothetical protein